MSEKFNPQAYEQYLASLNNQGPFKVWSGDQTGKQQYPPNWGHPSKEINSIFEAIYHWYDVSGDDFNRDGASFFHERAYVVDRFNELVLSLIDSQAVAFLNWLVNDRTSGGTTGLLHRHGIRIDY